RRARVADCAAVGCAGHRAVGLGGATPRSGAARASRIGAEQRPRRGLGAGPLLEGGETVRPGLLPVKRRELLLQPVQLRKAVKDDVRLVGVAGEIVLVVRLCWIKVPKR